MSRTIPTDRFRHLAETAVDVFIRQGYRRTQMSDIAAALGVAKGTLYLYVESKEALFDLALRNADHEHLLEVPSSLPLSTPQANETVAAAASLLAERGATPVLMAAIDAAPTGDVRTELDAIVRELYGACARNRRSIKLVDRCAADHPDIGALWFEGGREGQMALLVRYLDARPQLALGYADTSIVARIIVETIVFWSVHRHWDPHPQEVDEHAAEETVVSFVRRALIPEVDT